MIIKAWITHFPQGKILSGIRHRIRVCDVYLLKEQLIATSALDLKKKTAEELMIIYQQHSPEEAYAAFSELYSRFHQNVFSFLMKKVKNQADAEDLLQKVFLKIHDSKHLYKEKFKFEQWLFVIARTTTLDHFRAASRYENRKQKTVTETETVIGNDDRPSGTDFGKLSDDQKELLELKYIDELSYEEISKILNKSETSLRKIVSRLTISLRKGDV
jgi:RNA polymerase sigma-70 factor (ECF subfamily)